MIQSRKLILAGLMLTLCLLGSCYTEEPVTRIVEISGMHCEACEASIEESVGALAGIQLCEASYANGTARIVADNAAAVDLAVDRIQKMQFIVSLPDGQ